MKFDKAIFDYVNSLVARRLAWESTDTVFRTDIWSAAEAHFQWGKIGAQLTKDMLHEVARLNGAVYISKDGGRARIVKAK